MDNLDEINRGRIDIIRNLVANEYVDSAAEAGSLARVLLHDTLGSNHPLSQELEKAISKSEYTMLQSACKTVIRMHEEGMLKNPRLTIAGELENEILDIAHTQLSAAETNRDSDQKMLQLAIAAFLTGAAMEDALRRLCDENRVKYDTQKTTISKLQSKLYTPSDGVEIISKTENKNITAWADVRNAADHGKFSELTYTDVLLATIGVRAFIDKHLPS